LSFVNRTVFIKTIGVTYLGINGLYSAILGVLSLTELGVGTAMNFSLYKPVAENDVEMIKSLMQLYKRSYRWIAVIVSVVGISLIPALRYLVKEPIAISSNELITYYVVFLFNTITSYLVSYKFSLLNALQKNYIQTLMSTISRIIIYIIQILVLVLYRSFLIYLLIDALFQLLQKVYSNSYLNRHFPILKQRSAKPLTREERAPIVRNIRALFVHKIGEISVYQTDNILISSFINISTVGLVSNYNLVITGVSTFINIIFNSAISSLGNLVATESVEKQYSVFKVYRFLAFWLYGFASISFMVLLSPFVTLWLGADKTLAYQVIALIVLNYYTMGHRIVINNFKSAAGVFDADKYISVVQAIVNLVVSVILVRSIGLIGIYVGTLVQGLVASVARPVVLYRDVFRRNSRDYFVDSAFYIFIILEALKITVLNQNSTYAFVILSFLTLVIPNVVFYYFLRRREEFKYLKSIAKSKMKGWKGKDV
jgi:O-antigen/teichoic acid export membrane protein